MIFDMIVVWVLAWSDGVLYWSARFIENISMSEMVALLVVIAVTPMLDRLQADYRKSRKKKKMMEVG